MHSPFELPSLHVVTSRPQDLEVDVLIALRPAVGWDTAAERLSASIRQDLDAAQSRGEPVTDLGRVLVVSAAGPAVRAKCVIVVGAGDGPLTVEQVRRAVAAGALWARERRHRSIGVDLVGLPLTAGALSAAAAEAVVLANFNHGHLKSAARSTRSRGVK